MFDWRERTLALATCSSASLRRSAREGSASKINAVTDRREAIMLSCRLRSSGVPDTAYRSAVWALQLAIASANLKRNASVLAEH